MLVNKFYLKKQVFTTILSTLSTPTYVWFAQNSQEGCAFTSHLVHDWLNPTSTWKMAHFSPWPCTSTFSTNCIHDSFTFVETLRNFQFSSSLPFLCFFDISSLFTNVSLQETIEICANVLYDDDLVPPPFHKNFY